MIVDTSALVAILRREAQAPGLLRYLTTSDVRRISAATFLEAAIVVDSNRSPIASRELDEFIESSEIVVEPVTPLHARIAREAYRDFGKGSGHAAQLNFGDCFAYALAKATGEPLLYIGNDFGHTDITPAL